ncbi:hypothetical protein QVD17_37762 [Tagetes erecta]|uniref:Wall-associated receptor kinase galacturonan-binding domain-containing protein n=1 Tax=Tagetes erecta TaxID=13708 RepID=A0AAD8JXC1_TARER|nr:hypothetical protein QVD17_37762 [Tagetes erecta]
MKLLTIREENRIGAGGGGGGGGDGGAEDGGKKMKGLRKKMGVRGGYVKTGCMDKCGDVRIPYPFGIGAECSINQWYIVDCNSSTPYLRALNVEVLGVTLKNMTVIVNTPMIIDCQKPFWTSSEIMGVDFERSPFFFSKSHNKFVFKGCGNAVMMMDNGSVVTGCSTSCRNVTLSDINNCYGSGCCQTVIPSYLKSYKINITHYKDDDEGCGSAFLVNKASYEKRRLSKPFIVRNTSFIPMSFLWTLTDPNQFTCCSYEFPNRRIMNISDGTTVNTWECDYIGSASLEGSPYLKDGCRRYEDPDELDIGIERWL